VAGRCNASQDAQDTWDAENTSLASGLNAHGSDAGSVFADAYLFFARNHVQMSSSRLGHMSWRGGRGPLAS